MMLTSSWFHRLRPAGRLAGLSEIDLFPRLCSIAPPLALALLLSAISPARAERGADRPSESPTAGAFDCGTYKGNELENPWLHSHYRKSLERLPLQSSSLSFVYDNVWVAEDDGTMLLVGFNPFDTDSSSFHFEPNDSGSYDISSIPFTFDNVLGADLGLGDDNNASVALAFSFDVFGTPWTQVEVNANGIVAFGSAINPTGFYSFQDFFRPLPKIAPYFMDFNPAAGGAVYHKGEVARSTLTWFEVPEYGDTIPNTVQLVLHDDHSFDISFAGIGTALPGSSFPIIFGAHPGGTPPLEVISYSDDLPFSGPAGAGIYEDYLNLTAPRVNDVALLQRFYDVFPDSFFQVVFFTNFVQTMGGFANERNIKNDVQGIGLSIFDDSGFFGSAGALESRCNMNQIAAWPASPTQRFVGDGNNFLTIMGQEAGHRWGAFVNFVDSTGSLSNLILGRSDAHWSYYFDVDHSSLEGGNWEPTSGDSFVCPTKIDYFSDLDEYLFGFRLPEEVKTTFFVSSPTNNIAGNRSVGTPPKNAVATGTAVNVTIDDIIAAEGPRSPSEPAEEKDLRQAFIILCQNGDLPTGTELDKIVGFRRAWEDYFEVAMSGRMTVNTRLKGSPPVAVLGGHVNLAYTLETMENVTLRSLERGFTQFVPSGGRYFFRYMADSLADVSETVTIVASVEGYLPDTFTTTIPYGSEATHDFYFDPIGTSIEDGDSGDGPPPLALGQNVPNPFNPATEIRFSLPRGGDVRLAVYDPRGSLVRVLAEAVYPAGSHVVRWRGRNQSGRPVASGVYFYRLEAAGQVRTKKLILLK